MQKPILNEKPSVKNQVQPAASEEDNSLKETQEELK